MTFGSLYSGIGGADIGFERAGMTCEFQVEIKSFCQKVLARRWPCVRRWDDIRTFPPAGNWSVDCIVGGDPCQGNSNAGSVYKVKHEDLGTEFVRVVKEIRPRIVVRENPYPSRPDALWPWWRMRNELERLGYVVLPFRLRSCCLGACHRRDRVWLLGELANANGGTVRVQGCGADAGSPAGVQGADGERQWLRSDAGAVGGGPDASDADSKRLEGLPAWNIGRSGGSGEPGERYDAVPTPRVCRSRNEVPDLVDRLTALGNAIDPVCAEFIARLLMQT